MTTLETPPRKNRSSAQLLIAFPARTSDPDTSHGAAREVIQDPKQRQLTRRERLLLAYCAGGAMTDEEAATRAGILKGCWWRRCSDLRELQLTRRLDEDCRSSAGVLVMVCELTEKGYAAVSEILGRGHS